MGNLIKGELHTYVKLPVTNNLAIIPPTHEYMVEVNLCPNDQSANRLTPLSHTSLM